MDFFPCTHIPEELKLCMFCCGSWSCWICFLTSETASEMWSNQMWLSCRVYSIREKAVSTPGDGEDVRYQLVEDFSMRAADLRVSQRVSKLHTHSYGSPAASLPWSVMGRTTDKMDADGNECEMTASYQTRSHAHLVILSLMTKVRLVMIRMCNFDWISPIPHQWSDSAGKTMAGYWILSITAGL